MSDGFIWYDKTATDDRVWCVWRLGATETVRARSVSFSEGNTSLATEGHAELNPGRPRGAILAANIKTFDEVPGG